VITDLSMGRSGYNSNNRITAIPYCKRDTFVFYRNLYAKRADLNDLIAMCYLDEILTDITGKFQVVQKQRLLLGNSSGNDPELLFLD
jgi:ABC-type multidrug transport system ATPase subunit